MEDLPVDLYYTIFKKFTYSELQTLKFVKGWKPVIEEIQKMQFPDPTHICLLISEISNHADNSAPCAFITLPKLYKFISDPHILELYYMTVMVPDIPIKPRDDFIFLIRREPKLHIYLNNDKVNLGELVDRLIETYLRKIR